MPQEMKLELRIDAGFLTVPIVDDKDNKILGEIKFNPNDLDIAKRYKHVVEELEAITVPDNSDDNTLFEISENVKRQIDYLLGCKVSDDIFSICNPFTLTSNGDFFVENVISGIAGIIEQVTNQRLEKKKAKIKKATQKYHENSMKNAVEQAAVITSED